MNPDYPVTVSAWEAYTLGLNRESLWRQGRAINSRAFIRTLMAEGFSLEDVRQIMLYFTRAMVISEMKLPEDGPFDLIQMAEQDPLIEKP